jgi:hypothetical protein
MFAGLSALVIDGPAHASIQSPPEEACAGKAVDDACTLPSGESGACKAEKCNELDYSQGSPPQSVEVDCIVCVAGAAPPPGPGPVAIGGDGGASETAPATRAEAAAPAEPAGEATPEPPSSEARCSVTPGAGGWQISMLLLAAVVAGRRRRD